MSTQEPAFSNVQGVYLKGTNKKHIANFSLEMHIYFLINIVSELCYLIQTLQDSIGFDY